MKKVVVWIITAMLPIAIQAQTYQIKPLGNAAMDCGLKPMPRLGCQIDRCVNGRWTQICR